jgi:hypothetical protein
MSAENINDIGLIFDVIGVSILFFSGIDMIFWKRELYPKLTKIIEGHEGMEKRYKLHRFFQLFGLSIIIVGFCLQVSFIQKLFT